MAFVHLHNHSHYSLLDGLTKIKHMVSRAKELGMPALALTDHGNMYGVIEFYKECVKQGIKPIIGQEAYVSPNGLAQKRPRIDTDYSHLILWAKNLDGYRNLMRLTSIAHKQGFYYKPRMDREVIEKYASGLMASSACLRGLVAKAIIADKYDQAKEIVAQHLKIFGQDNYFLEVQHHPNLEKQQLVNQTIFRLSAEMGVPVIATCDCHYLYSSDNDAQDLLVCIASGKVVTDTQRLDMRENDLSMKNEAEMRAAFPDHPEACDQTMKVADRIELEIPLGTYHFPLYQIAKPYTADNYLKDRAYRGLAKRYRLFPEQNLDSLLIERIKQTFEEIDPKIMERLDYELDIIKQKGYSEYFLIVADYVAWAKEQKINTTTRGSAAGSLVSYAIEIIEINPLDYNLPFERFLNPLRPSAPDIDFDIQDDRRGEVLQYVIEKYGEEKVAQIITFGTMAARGAVRDVGRALGMPYNEVDRISKMIPMGSQGFPMTLERALEESPQLKQAYDTEPNTKRVVDFAKKVEGCARHHSIHAAGVVIAPGELTDYTPIQIDEQTGINVTQYEMHAVEEAGLVKMDFLGIRNLSILGRTIDIVKITRRKDVDILKIALDDKKTYKMLARGETFGVFQLSGRGMTRYLIQLKPNTIHDIMAMVALFRPGPMESIPEYISRKHDPKKISYPDPRLEKILEKSYGVLVYQDDVLYTAIDIAGYDWLEADKLRKAMGKKIPEEMAMQKEKFIQGCQDHGGLDLKKSQELFKLIEPFAAYGFNKAHAASYGLVAYQTAYMKANYPVEYMAAFMTAEHSDLDKVSEAIKECRRIGIRVLPPDINESLADFTVIDEKTIRFGLSAIKNVGEGIVDSIINERKINGSFESLSDLVTRVEDRNLNKKVLEAFAKVGALDSLAERNQILLNMETILSFAKTQLHVKASGQDSLFGSTEGKTILNLAGVEESTKKEQLAWEKELLGVYLSSHPFEKIAKQLNDLVTKMEHLDQSPENQIVCVAGMMTNVKTITTKKGQLMAFCQLDDETASRELVVFPRIFAEQPHLWIDDQTILARAKVATGDGQAKLICDKAWPITDDNLAEIKQVLTRGRLPASTSESTVYQQPTGVYIHLVKTLDQFRTEQLKNLFTYYKGDVPVYLKIGGSDYKTIKTSYRIRVDEETKYQLEKITGANSMRMVGH